MNLAPGLAGLYALAAVLAARTLLRAARRALTALCPCGGDHR